ncbi:hypothetical protein [Methylobacterium oryzihabitans]|uniref:Uncharacterized protein n=1 Tax=Methylobacterium oryzihabitans TaxID=2499852 RepID=A0A3S2VNK1_9HYPH|nr:hypothetical protein [Methylobacterium oryzihabitans]RVU13148.1 hypothetical protein EOE48_26940 [Methylobacterium oryzihabitans]
MPAPNPLPDLDAPFWRALPLAEFADRFGESGPPGTFDLAPGWTLALVSLSYPSGRATLWGWARPPFAIHLEHLPVRPGDDGVIRTLAGLSHLPSGRRIATFFTEKDAAAAAIVAPLLVGSVPFDSGHRATEALRAAGFRRCLARLPHGDTVRDLAVFWRRLDA